MEAQWVADRQLLRNLLISRPDWTRRDLAQALGRSLGWVKKWIKRLQHAPPDDQAVLHSLSRARKHPPPSLSQLVIERILDFRDHPPHNLRRIPGPKAILYYLRQEACSSLAGVRLPRSTRTIWHILRQYQRIQLPRDHIHQPLERPEPLRHWQLDFKDASSVPADPDGKQQHVVEVLNTIDVGTSILLSAQPRADFTMASAIEAVAAIVEEYGLPDLVTFDRDPRFVGSSIQRDCPSPFLRFWLCLGVQLQICPPRRPDLNGFVERYHRTYQEECLKVERPADLEAVKNVTAAFKLHYNFERPHQGLACQNQPPCQAYPVLPRRPPVPATVDPDRWIDVLDGQQFVRKVRHDSSVQLDEVRYYAKQELVGKYVTLRIEAATRSLVIEYEGQEYKRVAIRGTGLGRMPFAKFVEQLSQEARLGRGGSQPLIQQLRLALEEG
jgi:transposase InsO family protein